MNLSYRKASLNDVKNIQALIELSSKKLNSSYYTKKQIEAALKSAWTVDTQLIIDNTFWVAETPSGLIVGCGCWSKHKTLFGKTQQNSNLEKLNPSIDAAKIRAFFVHPDYTRKGIGNTLLTTCENEAKSFGFKTVELVATLSGEKLYSSKDYIPIKKYEADLVDGITNTVILMRKNL